MRTKNILAVISLAAMLALALLYVVYANFNSQVDEGRVKPSINTASAKLNTIHPVSFGVRYTHSDDTVLGFEGWSGDEGTHRWTDQKVAHIHFKVEDIALLPEELHIALELQPLESQNVDFLINDKHLLSKNIDHQMPIMLKVQKSDLNSGMNTLTFLLPGAKYPNSGDPRLLAIMLTSFELKK